MPLPSGAPSRFTTTLRSPSRRGAEGGESLVNRAVAWCVDVVTKETIMTQPPPYGVYQPPGCRASAEYRSFGADTKRVIHKIIYHELIKL